MQAIMFFASDASDILESRGGRRRNFKISSSYFHQNRRVRSEWIVRPEEFGHFTLGGMQLRFANDACQGE